MDAADWDERYRERELVWSAEPNVFVEQEVGDLPAGRALDLAAGEGRNAIWLATRGWEVEAVEFSPVAIDKGRALTEHAGVDVTWTLADLTTEPALEPADLVLLVYLHLPQPAATRVLRHAAGLVHPAGTLLVVGHARRNLMDGYGGPPDARLLAEPDEVAATLQRTGLEIERAEEVVRQVETEEGPRDAIDLLVRGRRATG
jgi:2-polyprenyl-3-methyl-5-hydroxy-6-metoxy-1,4-benzoquinol methylase